VDLKQTDEEVNKGVAVREIIATHRAVRKSLSVLWFLSLALLITSASFDWFPGSLGGTVGAVASSVALTLHDRKKIK
jgi:hypothetical protein